MIESQSFARAGLLGNPSDGYHGKTIAFSVRNFFAQVRLVESPQLSIEPLPEDALPTYASTLEFMQQVERFGYHGSLRLVKASIKTFFSWCQQYRAGIHDRSFTLQYSTNIPRSVGMAGSSAIITAILKALNRFYEANISPQALASMALQVEHQELGIAAGLMDRVIQMLDDVVFMDFDQTKITSETGYEIGHYETLSKSALEEKLYLAWANQAAEPTEVLHNRLKERFMAGDQDVVTAMGKFAEFAEQGREALRSNDLETLNRLIDANFDLRTSICQLPELHHQMVTLARHAGASAKFCGSGGAITGIAADQVTFQRVTDSLAGIGCQVIRPIIRRT